MLKFMHFFMKSKSAFLVLQNLHIFFSWKLNMRILKDMETAINAYAHRNLMHDL
jgi:hypothetical protein